MTMHIKENRSWGVIIAEKKKVYCDNNFLSIFMYNNKQNKGVQQ
ncbi:hypothetical protein bsdtb5_15440 [Anaeromicropila herbilytica]|uniref:Uncharacterized protein n=1 Tax=Anaeromicropila herbilytica TaxID=2785025 RepID=A0A7R7EK47_9FIRM|nr:hypothetical protein bsdtb5_15440 [Anaeromicropila herbilytica]